MENLIEMGSSGLAANLVHNAMSFTELRSSRARTAFQWEEAISALFLLIVIVLGEVSLTDYLSSFVSSYKFSNSLVQNFKFGYWIAFLAVAANLLFPETFPVSRFVLFVITPEWLANGLRDSIAGGVFCVIIAVSLVLVDLGESGGLRSCGCNCYCFFYFLGISFLFFFTILCLSLGTW